MKNQLIFTFCLATLVAGTIIVPLASCKKTTNPNAQFIGTYPGRFSTGTPYAPDTLVITAGSTSSTVNIMEDNSGTTYTGNVSGDSIIISTQPSAINGASITITGGLGVLSGSSFDFTSSGQLSGGGPYSYSFQGTKE